MSYQAGNTHQERIKNSPLAKLDPPLPSLVKPLSKTNQDLTSQRLSSSSYAGLRKDLVSIIRYVMTNDLIPLNRVTQILIEELHNLESCGQEYLIDMDEGG